MEYDDLLRRLSLHDERVISELGVAASADLRMSGSGLDPKTLALVRLAALVTIGGSVPSYGAHVDAAVGAGASAWEIVDVLLGVVPVVGLPRVVTAAPQLALALGHDVEDDFGSLPQG